jgi:hypothetical protein
MGKKRSRQAFNGPFHTRVGHPPPANGEDYQLDRGRRQEHSKGREKADGAARFTPHTE